MNTRNTLLSFCFLLLAAGRLSGAAYFVDGDKGSDDASGEESAPLRTIQSAVNRATAGDSVIVLPGVYFESVEIRGRGTSERPIVIKAADGELNRTIVTGARKDVRTRAARWELADPATGTYRMSHAGGFPARVLYDGIDLFPYPSLETLQAFQSPLSPVARPRPRHGYTYDEAAGVLYVRLHPDGKYGSTDPNEHIMAVAPPVAGGFNGTLIRKRADYGIAVLGAGPAHVIIDGFTLETPAVAGAYVEGSDVTVRNCWFRGCRTGVSGNYEDRPIDPAKGYEFFNLTYDPSLLATCAARVVVEQCDFTQEPCIDDIAEILASLPDETDPVALKRNGMTKRGGLIALWTRKDVSNGGLPSETFKYEIGIANFIGRDWVIRRNRIHNVFEGLSCHATGGSKGLQVVENLISGACDNAIEMEDHAEGMSILRNVIHNSFESISYQPLRGEPWPTDIVIAGNLIYNDRGDLYADEGIRHGAFKWGITRKNWDLPAMKDRPLAKGDGIALPGAGVDIHDNAVFFPGMLIKNVNSIPIDGFRMHDNVIVTGSLIGDLPEKNLAQWAVLMAFRGNFCAPGKAGGAGPGNYTAGPGGMVFSSESELAKSAAAIAILKKAGLVEVLANPSSEPPKPGTFLVGGQFVFRTPEIGPQISREAK